MYTHLRLSYLHNHYSPIPFPIYDPGLLTSWVAKKSLAEPTPSVSECNLSRFRAGLLSAALSQPLLSFHIDPAIKQYWASIRQQLIPLPTCYHQSSTCSCGATFNTTSEEWKCGHHRVNGEEIACPTALLFDINSPPLTITTYVRVCQKCGVLVRSSSLKSGIFNFDERHLLTVPLLLFIRNSLSFGTPLHTVISSWARSLYDTFGYQLPTAIITKIKAAFLAFEALSDHGESSTCLLCKDDPTHLIFDGNAKLVFKVPGVSMLYLPLVFLLR